MYLEDLIDQMGGRFKFTVLCQKRLQELCQFAKISGGRQESNVVGKVFAEVQDEKITFLPPWSGGEGGEGGDKHDPLPLRGEETME